MNINSSFFLNVVICAFVLFIVFPYVTPIRTGSDIQPYAMLMSFLVIFIFGVKIDETFILIVLFFIVSLCLLFISKWNFSDVRSCASIVSFCVVSLALHRLFSLGLFIPRSFFEIAAIIYALAALVQLFISSDAFLFLSPRGASYDGFQGRGVESLTAEPTFYGFLMILIFLCYFFSKENGKELFSIKSFFIFILLQIVFLAKSSSAILTLLIVYFSLLFPKVKNKFVFLLVGGGIFCFFYIFNYFGGFDGTRFGDLLHKIDDPWMLVQEDLSINDRVFNIYFSIQGAIENNFYPRGFGAWHDYVSSVERFNLYVTNITSEDERILSLIGGLLFEFGFLSIFFFIYIIWSIKRCLGSYLGSVLSTLGFFVFFIQAIPVSHPVFCLLIVIMWNYKTKNSEHYFYNLKANNI